MDRKITVKAEKHLRSDPVMGKLIDEHGTLDWSSEVEPFSDLVYSIVSQQLSDKASTTIYGRFRTLMGKRKMAPENILAIEDKLIRDCGISYPKISYIKLLSTAVRSGEIDLIELNNLGSDEVIFELTKIKGVGRWTAEMFLMSTLKHPDIFSVGDLGLRKAVSNLYGVDRNDHKTILSIAERWKPYRTFASRYLWRSLDED